MRPNDIPNDIPKIFLTYPHQYRLVLYGPYVGQLVLFVLPPTCTPLVTACNYRNYSLFRRQSFSIPRGKIVPGLTILILRTIRFRSCLPSCCG